MNTTLKWLKRGPPLSYRLSIRFNLPEGMQESIVDVPQSLRKKVCAFVLDGRNQTKYDALCEQALAGLAAAPLCLH